MLSIEDIQLYLPKYLSPESSNQLFENLEDFPNNIDKRLYSSICQGKDIIYQGDGLYKLPVIKLPEKEIKEIPVMVLTNTCDNYPENEKFFNSCICYCPILNLNKYKEMLLINGEPRQSVESHIESIKKQRVSQIFYVPNGALLKEESIVFFDRIVSCESDSIIKNNISNGKLFSLSDYGLYLFVFKLSVFFTRLNEGQGRNS